jgi:hypothetical protein
VIYDATEDACYAGPFVTEADVAGLYHPDVAAVASRATASDPGSGPTRIDD